MGCRTLLGSQLESIVRPLGILVAVISAVLAVLILVTLARALAGACSEGRISFNAYREATFFAAAAFIAGIVEFDICAPTRWVAAVAGYLLPMLLRSEIAAPKEGA